MSYILDIGTAVPDYSLTQDEFSKIYCSQTDNEDVRRKIKFLTARSAIQKRHCVDPNITNLIQQSLPVKLEKYHNEASKLAIKAVNDIQAFQHHKNGITDLIFISCTGMQAPGVEIDLISHFDLPENIRRYNVNFMGCYAALTGLRMANDICAVDPNRKVLLVSVELCTLHFQNKFNDDYLLSNSIFADGAAAAIISSNQMDSSIYQLKNFESRLLPDSKDEMSWKISPEGFLMTLSSSVPKSISKSLNNRTLFDVNPSETDWAIHPGGKQVIDGIKSTIGLEEKVVNSSRKILREYGNMSSATVLFVLQEMSQTKRIQNKDIVACAFGPGLTLEAALLSYV
ncbi:MAG: type III polyketide synthase [Bacteroidia bacterium]